MNSLGLSVIFKMGCLCAKEEIYINNERYTARDVLAHGGFGVIQMVENNTSHKMYVLKRIKCHSLEDERIAIKEGEFYKQFQHRNIIQCLDFNLRKSNNYINDDVTEALMLFPYYKKGTLQDELQRRQRSHQHLTESYIFKLFVQICSAVSAMHNHKPNPLAHRDLKPANILFKTDDDVVVIDLGSMDNARIEISNVSQALQLQDTAAERSSMPYRAPELFNVESLCHIDERTDIWSLGCLLYALCFFDSPFQSVYEKGNSIALAVVSGNVAIPESSRYSRELHQLILKMLTVNPLERPLIDDILNQCQSLVELEASV